MKKPLLEQLRSQAERPDNKYPHLFEIEQDVPLPPDITIRRHYYPWKHLKPGDSFFVPAKKVNAMTAKSSWAGKKYNKRFICRTVDGGVRVWCLGTRDDEAGSGDV